MRSKIGQVQLIPKSELYQQKKVGVRTKNSKWIYTTNYTLSNETNIEQMKESIDLFLLSHFIAVTLFGFRPSPVGAIVLCLVHFVTTSLPSVPLEFVSQLNYGVPYSSSISAICTAVLNSNLSYLSLWPSHFYFSFALCSTMLSILFFPRIQISLTVFQWHTQHCSLDLL